MVWPVTAKAWLDHDNRGFWHAVGGFANQTRYYGAMYTLKAPGKHRESAAIRDQDLDSEEERKT